MNEDMVKLDRRWIIRRLPHELFEENVSPRLCFAESNDDTTLINAARLITYNSQTETATFRHSWFAKSFAHASLFLFYARGCSTITIFARNEFQPSNLIEYPPTRISLATINVYTMGNGNSFSRYAYIRIHMCMRDGISIFVEFDIRRVFFFFSSSIFVQKSIIRHQKNFTPHFSPAQLFNKFDPRLKFYLSDTRFRNQLFLSSLIFFVDSSLKKNWYSIIVYICSSVITNIRGGFTMFISQLIRG